MIGTVAPLFALAVFLLARNWGGWIDPLVDFGREAYLAWRLAEGDVLYRDIAYLDGPLSPYWNALWFEWLPVSLRTLESVNIAILGCAAALIHALLLRLAGSEASQPLHPRIVAAAGVALFLCVFAVNLIGSGGNMNWVAPYSHGITHGVTLALASVWCFLRHLQRGRTLDVVACGLLLGLTALTKPEVFLAALAAIGLGGAAAAACGGMRLRGLAVLAAAASLPIGGAFACLVAAMGVREAALATLGGWAHLVASDVSTLHFYRWVMGIDAPAENLARMAGAAGVWALVLVPALAASFAGSGGPRANALRIAMPLAIVGCAPLAARWYAWQDILRPLALVLAVCVANRAYRLWRDGATAVPELTVSVLGLVLLGKIALKPILVGYAFALAVPGALVVTDTLLRVIPASIERRGGDGRLFARCALSCLALVSFGCLLASETVRVQKTVPVGEGGDRFFAAERRRAHLTEQLRRWVETSLAPDATLLVLPEGAMINYLTRRINPTRHLNFLPPELAVFDERRILADLDARPPEFVALIQRETSEYGLPLFGTDYGQPILAWARRRYDVVGRAGAEPLQPQRLRDHLGGFEVRALRRGPPAQP